MTQTYTEDVLIDGSQDTTQLTVQGHSTQDDPLQVWEDSSGDELAQVTGDGRLQVGSFSGGAMETDDSLIEVHRDEADTAKPTRGLHLLGQITGTLSSAVQWAVQELELLGTGGISALHSALRVKLSNENTGDAGDAQLRAGDFEVVNEGGSSGDPVGEMTGIRVAVTNQGSGYVEEAIGVDVVVEDSGQDMDAVYGIRVGDVNQGSSENYALHTGEGIVHLGDFLELAELSQAPDEATGVMRLYPKTDGKLYAKNASGQEYEITGSGATGGALQWIGW
jgi:hypothetical protein